MLEHRKKQEAASNTNQHWINEVKNEVKPVTQDWFDAHGIQTGVIGEMNPSSVRYVGPYTENEASLIMSRDEKNEITWKSEYRISQDPFRTNSSVAGYYEFYIVLGDYKDPKKEMSDWQHGYDEGYEDGKKDK